MKLVQLLAAAVMLSLGFGNAVARDDRLRLPIADALATSGNSKNWHPAIKLYFSGQPHGPVETSYGEFTSNKKTNFFNKSDREGCEWVFLSAVIALQQRAIQEGGDGVIDIHSVYKNDELKSATDYECGAGAIVGGVALRGTVVKLK